MDYDQLIQSALDEIENVESSDSLEEVRVKYFGKNGVITNELKSLSSMSIDKKKEVGIKLNIFKSNFFSSIEQKKNSIAEKEITLKLEKDSVDSSLPPRDQNINIAKVHPINQTISEITSILGNMGLVYEEGPDVEDDFHNFSALNIPLNHPARQMHDTFYLDNDKKDKFVLRTHTSPVQIRSLKKKKNLLKFLPQGELIDVIPT